MENNGNPKVHKRRSRRDRHIDDDALKTGEIPQIIAEEKPQPKVELSIATVQIEAIYTPKTITGEKPEIHQKYLEKRKRRKKRVRPLNGVEKVKANLPLLIAMILGASVITAIGFWINYEHNQLELSTDIKNSAQVTGKVGANPVLILKNSMPFTLKKEQILITGKGPVLQPNDDVFLKISVFNGNTGKLLNKNSLPRQVIGKNNADFLGQELYEAVKNKKIGSRLLIKRPVKTNGKLNSMEIDVVDILPTVIKTAEIPQNLPVAYAQQGELPQLNDSKFSFDTSQLFIIKRGAGRQIPADSKVITQVGIWHGGVSMPVTYSWNKQGPRILDLAKSYRSLAKQLPDIREGSRILLTIPAEDADGDTSVAVVLDILEIANP